MTTKNPLKTSAATPADAGRRNMLLLILLRWLAVGGQLVTIAVADRLLGIKLPLAPLLIVPLLLAAINLFSVPYLRRRPGVSNLEVTTALLIDVAALAWQLHHSGGLANPFAWLFLLQVVIGAMLLEPRTSWGVVVAALVGVGTLTLDPQPLVLPPRYAADPLTLYLLGSLVCFVLIAVLLVAFVTRISRNLREADAALATARQRAAEEDHIVRMGLLASGAAHELGTPMSTISVILGDLVHHPAVAQDEDLQADVEDMQAELQRCKLIVSGILTAAGEVRGENPSITTVRTFLTAMADEWRGRTAASIRLDDQFGEDVTIVSDPALRQVISNVIENALEASRTEVTVQALRRGDDLVLNMVDDGPGFTAEMLETFGRPYATTKGRTGGGLGLFLVVNVLRKFGGTVEVSNRAGGGASVRLTIPLAALAYEASR
jgi:two-component system, sensor histidine kinase RegB